MCFAFKKLIWKVALTNNENYKKRRCHYKNTISPPIADPPQVLLKIPFDQ